MLTTVATVIRRDRATSLSLEKNTLLPLHLGGRLPHLNDFWDTLAAEH